MTPCHPMRTACVRAGTSPRAAWWASWSTPLNSSARSVLTGVPGPPRGPDSQRHECQSSPRAGRTSCWAVQGWGGVVAPDDFDVCKLHQFCWEPRKPFITAIFWFSWQALRLHSSYTVLFPFNRVEIRPQRGEMACPGLHHK